MTFELHGLQYLRYCINSEVTDCVASTRNTKITIPLFVRMKLNTIFECINILCIEYTINRLLQISFTNITSYYNCKINASGYNQCARENIAHLLS